MVVRVTGSIVVQAQDAKCGVWVLTWMLVPEGGPSLANAALLFNFRWYQLHPWMAAIGSRVETRKLVCLQGEATKETSRVDLP